MRFRFLKGNNDFLVCFDRGDVAWLRAYCHLLMGILDFPVRDDMIDAWLAMMAELVLAMVFGGVMKELTPSNPATWVVLVLLNVMQFLAAGPTKWIRVDYTPYSPRRRDQASPLKGCRRTSTPCRRLKEKL